MSRLHLHERTTAAPDVDAVVVRDGKKLKGRVVGAIVGSIGPQWKPW